MRQAKIQIRLRTRSLTGIFAGCILGCKDAFLFHVDNEDSDQAARMRSLN